MLPTQLKEYEKTIGWCNNTLPISEDWENLVVFHHPCNDGFAAALVAWKFFPPQKTIFWPAQYNQKYLPLGLYENKKVYILDFSFPKEFFGLLQTHSKRVVWLDHHESAIKDYLGRYVFYKESNMNLSIILDPERSGAAIAYEYFFNEHPPKFIEMISDRDLWKFKIQGSKELHAYLQVASMDFKAWEHIWEDLEDVTLRNRILDIGNVLLLQYHAQIKSLLSGVTIHLNDEGLTYAKVNCPGIFSSDLCSLILEENPKLSFVTAYNILGDEVRVSLRSRKGEYNVAELAKTYGGGGHQPAAGFVTTIEKFFKL